MLFQGYEPRGDAPPRYLQHLAATWRQNLVLAALGVLGAGIAQLVMGGCVVLWTSHRLRRDIAP